MPPTPTALYQAWRRAMRTGTFAEAQAALAAYYATRRDAPGQAWAQAPAAAASR